MASSEGRHAAAVAGVGADADESYDGVPELGVGVGATGRRRAQVMAGRSVRSELMALLESKVCLARMVKALVWHECG